jgi:hypothetical protein
LYGNPRLSPHLMKDCTARNRAFLDSAFPGISPLLVPPHRINDFVYLEGPPPNIRHRRKTLHARRSPEREAVNLVRDIPVRGGLVLLILGLGLGHQVRQLRKRFSQTFACTTVIVVERSVESFSLLCAREDVSFLEGTSLFVGEAADRVERLIEQLSPLEVTGQRVIALRGSTSLYPDYYERIERSFRRILAGKLSDLLTRFAFEGLWARNLIDNLPSLVDRKSIAALRNGLRGQPVLVIGAGPSLYQQLDLIGSLQTRVHLIAVDTALTPLLKSGTVPDFVVTLDAGFYNSLDFKWQFIEGGSTERMTLIADMVSCPLILTHWVGPVYFSETSPSGGGKAGERNGLPLLDQFRKHYPALPALDCGGSISTTAIELALFMGAETVYVTGLDLSYTDYKSHVNSTAQYELLLRMSERFNPVDTAMIRSIGERRLEMRPGLGGGEVLSDFVFSQYLHWLESRTHYGNRVLNCTARGVSITSMPPFSLEEAAGGGFLPARKRAVRTGYAETLSPSSLFAFLDELDTALSQVREEMGERPDPRLLADRHQTFASLILETQKLYGSGPSLYRHLGLMIDFIEKHVIRARTRLLRK